MRDLRNNGLKIVVSAILAAIATFVVASSIEMLSTTSLDGHRYSDCATLCRGS